VSRARQPGSSAGPAGEPFGAAAVQVLHLRADQPRHVALDVVSDLGLDVGQMAVTGGELREQPLIELRSRPAGHRGETVDLIDRLAQDHAVGGTYFLTALQEVVEAPRADDVALHALDDR